METCYFHKIFTAEAVPCAPTLEAWAQWLHDPRSGRLLGGWLPAMHNTLHDFTVMTLFDDLLVDENLQIDGDPDPLATHFALRDPAAGGWTPDDVTATLGDIPDQLALLAPAPGAFPFRIAQMRLEPDERLRYLCDAPGPRFVSP